MPIDNDIDLTKAIVADMHSIINVVIDQLFEKLISNTGFIERIVYDAGTPSEYPRQRKNGGLLDDWEKIPAKVTGNVVTAEINEEPGRMRFYPQIFVHSSYYWKDGPTDVRSLLVDIITDGLSGPLFGDLGYWLSPRDFWSPFIELLEDGTVDRMIEAEFRKRNIQYIKL